MAAETQYTANTGIVTISTANTNLDGTGTLGTVLTAASNGTLIRTVTVKSQATTTNGMVRLFIYDGSFTRLIAEIPIPGLTKVATEILFETVISLNFYLKSGWVLQASTEKADTFNIIAEGLDWEYYTTSVRADTTQNQVYSAAGGVSTANANVNGTGTMTTLMGSANNGLNILSLTAKAKVNTTDGMIRFFIYNGTTAFLWREIKVNAVNKSATAQSFVSTLRFPDAFALQLNYEIRVSTENPEAFAIIGEGLSWLYPA